MNPNVSGLYCIACGKTAPVGDAPDGCPACRAAGHPASMSLRYARPFAVTPGAPGMARYQTTLPYRPGEYPTLGEGGTPLVPLPRLAAGLGLAALFSKNEFQNPTGSHKDRMNPFIVARARERGFGMVAAASSGNEGVSLACYAAAAGLGCTVVATRAIAPLWRRALAAAGARLVLTDTPHQRWALIRQRVDAGEWYPATNTLDPPVGSCLYGVQGYKTIAYELYEQAGDALPDFVLVPNSRGDLLWGIFEGFTELAAAGRIGRVPALVAVEPFPRLALVDGPDGCARHFPGNSALTPSIGGDTATVQSFLAVRDSGGCCVSAGQDEVAGAVREMAGNGLYLEESSALPLACLKKLVAEGTVPPGSRVVLIATSHGFKGSTVQF